MVNLVTGATGFVGTHLVNKLLTRGNSVRALVRSDSDALTLRSRGVETVVGDLCDRQVLVAAVRGAKIIYHCAAASCLHDEDEIRSTNLDGIRKLLHIVRDESAGRLILMSSLNVLGSSSFEEATEESPTQRSGELHTDVKIDVEELALQFSGTHSVDVTILRPGMIYGPGERHMPGLASTLQSGKFTFIGSRHNNVPLIFVGDMVRAMMLAAESPHASGRIYNLTDGSRTTIGQLAGAMAELLGARSPKRIIPYALPHVACTVYGLVGRPGPISHATLRFLGTSRHVCIARSRHELGFEPEIGLRRGLEMTMPWLIRAIEAEVKLSRAA